MTSSLVHRRDCGAIVVDSDAATERHGDEPCDARRSNDHYRRVGPIERDSTSQDLASPGRDPQPGDRRNLVAILRTLALVTVSGDVRGRRTVFRKKREKHATWTPPSTDSFRVSGSSFSTAQGRVVETRIGDRDRDRDRDRAHAVDQPRILASLYPRYRGISTLGGCAVARATESQGGEGVCSTHATGWVLDARRGGGNTRRERRQRGQRIAVSSTAVGRRSRTARTRVGG